ncbi:MAG: thioredoxin domain-containing protein [Methanoregula sp.]|nr:thioredoxin domain-containing protein [Methanoregula sp.]
MMPDPHHPPDTPDTQEKQVNRLIHEKSPYLLQHAHNPVDWYPWGTEAFTRALKENKPVFLSIGYATCHWCHVMAHESFEDTTVAGILNTHFISVKVDREERPDIDGIYMSVCQLMTGQGGWPLTIFMTPEKKPFFSGTYFPKESRFGRTGLTELLPRIIRLWQERHDDLVASAEEITAALRQQESPSHGEAPDRSLLNKGYEELVIRFDTEYGGFGSAPKFPTPHTLLFLLRFWKRTGDKRALAMVEKTLYAMRQGGIFDQVGGGFHRYSTDAQWRVPHFEKMLYDQALLVMAYTEAFQATRNPDFLKTAEDTISYVFRNLTSPDGAFYSAEDADSSGGEGVFYLWTAEETKKILGNDDAIIAASVFDIIPEGNYQETGIDKRQNILSRKKTTTELALSFGLKKADLEIRLESIRSRLFDAREKRPRPSLDDKILADWNGLFIAALAQAARVSGNETYLTAAKKAMQFILTRLRTPDGGLMHRYREGEPAIPAFGDDYAFTIKALLELYESTFESAYLSTARELSSWFEAHFHDKALGGFFTSADLAEILLVRKKEVYDGAIPSCNSVAFENLVRLAHLTGDVSYERLASELSETFASPVHQSPSAHAWYLCALNTALGPVQDIVIVGEKDADDTKALINGLREYYLPLVMVVLKPLRDDDPRLASLAPFTSNLTATEGKPTAYICTGHSCAMPITDLNHLRELLGCMKTD